MQLHNKTSVEQTKTTRRTVCYIKIEPSSFHLIYCKHEVKILECPQSIKDYIITIKLLFLEAGVEICEHEGELDYVSCNFALALDKRHALMCLCI